MGDQVLILLPTDRNKLLMQWKGPFPVWGKNGELDHEVDLGHNIKLFHINLLKKYEERPPEGSVTQAAKVCVAVEEEEAKTHEFPLLCLEREENSGNVEISPGLSPSQQVELKALLTNFDDIFSDVQDELT